MAQNTFIDEVAGFSGNIQQARSQRSTAPVSVRFKGGQSIALNLSDARHRGWSRILESQQRLGKPVYVDLDPNTSELRRLLFPLTSTVRALRPHVAPPGLAIELTLSAAVQVLRDSHPRYAEFSALLREALERGTALLVTDTNDTHEIVDVRGAALPDALAKKARDLARDVGIQTLTPVTPARAQELFDLAGAGTCAPADPDAPCVPFMYPDDGCWARAHEMCRLMANAGQESLKVWIRRGTTALHANTSNHPSCGVDWGWHVAPVLAVSIAGAVETWVIDPALFPTPVPLDVWFYAQHSADAVTSISERGLYMKFGGPTTDPNYTLTQSDMGTYRNRLLQRFLDTEGPPYSVCYKEDLYLRDNLDDQGLEPLPRGGISCSPDINHFREELADPQAALGSASAKARDDLFERAEFGQPNYIYVRLQNRGSAAADATIDVYYSLASSLPTPASWQRIGAIQTSSPVAPGEFRVAGPLVWDTVPQAGHYCFIAVVDTPRDAKPDLSAVHTIDDFYALVRKRNNVTWKNFDVENFFADSIARYSFVIRGWPRIPYRSDLELDTAQLPAGTRVELRLLKRLTIEATVEQLEAINTTSEHITCRVTALGTARVRDMALRASDQSAVVLSISTGPQTPSGAYQFSLRQLIEGNEVGRVTQRLNIGAFPYMGNRGSLELHVASCEWARQISPRNKVAFENTARPIAQGYNGCAYCLRELNTDGD